MVSLPANDVRDAIRQAGFKWEARDTRISELARAARPGNLFGLAIGEPERLALMREGLEESAKFSAVAPPPPRIDWRNHNGDWVTSVKYQATCGACVAFATCAVLESRAMIGAGNPGAAVDLSETHLFACGGGQCAVGWDFEPALRQARGTGVGDEADFPYTPKDVPCRAVAPVVTVTGWSKVTTMNARKHAIAANGPVIAGMRVYSDFYSYGSGVYKHATGAFEGLHAVAVVGYDDRDDYWIVKNSWDTDWGEAGFVRMGYGECGIDSEFPFFDPDVAMAPPATV
jgi:C1A family cysteine protease